MNRTYTNALVLRNDGDTAILKLQDGTNQEVTFLRGKESLREFLQMFPLQGVVQIFHPEEENSPKEEKKNVMANWITVNVLSNDGDEALVRYPGGEKVRFYRVDESQSDFVKAWPPGDMAEFKIVAAEHGVSNLIAHQSKGRRHFLKREKADARQFAAELVLW